MYLSFIEKSFYQIAIHFPVLVIRSIGTHEFYSRPLKKNNVKIILDDLFPLCGGYSDDNMEVLVIYEIVLEATDLQKH